VAVGAAMMLATTAVVIAANSANDAAQQNVTAYNAARQVVENLRTFKSATIKNNTYTDVTVFGAVPQLAQLNNATATLVVSSPKSGSSLKRAIVTINWKAGDRSLSKSRTLVALFMKNGVAP
jgi:hypothetical protein